MKYLTAKQASKILKISPRRIREKINQKRRKCFPGAFKIGNQWIIPEEEALKEYEYIKLNNFKKDLLGKCVSASVGDFFWDSVWSSAWESVENSVWDSVRASVRDSVWASVRDSVWDSVWDSVGNSVWASVKDSVWEAIDE